MAHKAIIYNTYHKILSLNLNIIFLYFCYEPHKVYTIFRLLPQGLSNQEQIVHISKFDSNWDNHSIEIFSRNCIMKLHFNFNFNFVLPQNQF